MSDHVYSSDFYSYIDSGSRRSAHEMAELLLREFPIGSLLDIGSGHGAWAAEWIAAGVKDVIAVDGDYVRRDQLAIPPDNFVAHDLSTPLELNRRFDLVQTLEVAEHLPAGRSDMFVESVVRHGDIVLFSAAVPHQGGEHHVNEQPPEYWRAKFAGHGYAAYDFVRPGLRDKPHVKPWYRFNAYLYASPAGQERLSPAILATRVPDNQPLTIGGDMRWALRRSAVRLIPTGMVKPIAMAKAAIEARIRAR